MALTGKFDYGRFQSTALRLIERYGKPGIIRKAGALVGDASNPVPGPTTDYACTLYDRMYDANQVDGTLVQQSDHNVYIASSRNPEITEADRIVVDGVEMRIVPPLRIIKPGGTVIYYDIQCRL